MVAPNAWITRGLLTSASTFGTGTKAAPAIPARHRAASTCVVSAATLLAERGVGLGSVVRELQ